MLKKISITFLSALVLLTAALPTAFAALETFSEVYTEFAIQTDGQTRTYSYDDVGSNNRNFKSGDNKTYPYNVTLRKVGFLGITSNVSTITDVPTNQGNITYSLRWKDVNTSGNGKFLFRFHPTHTSGSIYYWGYVKPLSEE